MHVLGLPAGMQEGSKLFVLNLHKGGLDMSPDMTYTKDKVSRVVTEGPKSCGDVRKHSAIRT